MLHFCLIRRAFQELPHTSRPSHIHIIKAYLYILYIQYADIIVIIKLHRNN